MSSQRSTASTHCEYEHEINIPSLPSSSGNPRANLAKIFNENLKQNIEGEINKYNLPALYNDILMNRPCDKHRTIMRELLLLNMIKSGLYERQHQKNELMQFYEILMKRPDLSTEKHMLLYILVHLTRLDFTSSMGDLYN